MKGLNLVRVEYFQWCLVIVLSGVDATLGDGCESWEYLHSFKEVKRGNGVSPRFHLLVLRLV